MRGSVTSRSRRCGGRTTKWDPFQSTSGTAESRSGPYTSPGGSNGLPFGGRVRGTSGRTDGAEGQQAVPGGLLEGLRRLLRETELGGRQGDDAGQEPEGGHREQRARSRVLRPSTDDGMARGSDREESPVETRPQMNRASKAPQDLIRSLDGKARE